MQTTTLVLLALGLSMDAFAVSISNSLCYRNMTRRRELAASASFGFFQGLMPVAGFFAGRLFESLIQSVDHWLALLLLGFIGGKMIWDGWRSRRQESCPAENTFTLRVLLMQAVATSIDALAVGISLAALSVNIWTASGLIAGITFLVCLAGCLLGRVVGKVLGNWAQMAGGAILVFIGLRVFLEHLSTGV